MMTGGPNATGNRLLEQAWIDKIPIIYFLGISSGRYVPIVPAFVYDWNPRQGKCQVGPGKSKGAATSIVDQRPFEPSDDRRYYVHQTQQRAHQAIFRAAVMEAYGNRCAISGTARNDAVGRGAHHRGRARDTWTADRLQWPCRSRRFTTPPSTPT